MSLLIVIIVVGIIASMLLLAGDEVMSSSQASNIVNNLRNIKTATLAWYADHLNFVNEKGKIILDLSNPNSTSYVQEAIKNKKIDIAKYLNNSSNITLNHVNKGDLNEGRRE